MVVPAMCGIGFDVKEGEFPTIFVPPETENRMVRVMFLAEALLIGLVGEGHRCFHGYKALVHWFISFRFHLVPTEHSVSNV
jgi:hypothetical protein